MQNHLWLKKFWITFSFLNSVERITQPDYKPTEQDILLSHKQTTGIVEVKFRMKGVDFQ